MIESIIDYLNAKLALIGYFDQRYCLTEIKSEGENTFPVCYSANGDWKKIQIDQHDGVTYWRKSGDVSSSKVDNPFTTDVLYETTFPLRLVAFKRRGDVGADDNYTADRLVDVIKKQITFVNETLKSTLKARKVECIVTGSTTNSADVLADEFDPPFAPDVPFKWSAVAVEVDVMVVGTSDCMDACPTDTDILHGFDFCKQVVVDRLTPTQKTCLQAKICGDADDATLDINGAPFTTIPSGDTYDLDVVNSDDDAVGTSAAGDWVIADSTVQNNATPTWSDTVKAEGTLTLAQAKMQDSDGSTTVLADYKPNTDGFMFTATQCTGGWQRPSEWLTMPTTVDGDAVTYLLWAVWENQPNYFAMRATTSSGNYTVDLYNDGTAVTNHASNVVSEFDLDYTKGTDEFAARGYKQVIIKITGNITTLDFNRRHSDESTAYNTGLLSLKITSQAITSLANLCRAQNVYHRNLEEFEYFGTCNVTSISYLLQNCFSVAKITANFSNVTDATFAFGGIETFDASTLTMPAASTSTSGQYVFYAAGRADFVGSDAATILRSNTYPYRAFYTARTEFLGTPDHPMQMDNSTSLAQMCWSAVQLKQIYLTNTGNVTSISNILRGCTNVRVASLGDMSSCTSTANAFTTNYSLATLEMTGMSVSFDVSGCHFNREGLVNIFNDLPNATATVTVSNNPGTADLTADDLLIATDKGWTVTT